MQVRIIGDYNAETDFVKRTGIAYDEIVEVWQGEDAFDNSVWPNRHGKLWVVAPNMVGTPTRNEQGEVVVALKSEGYHPLKRGDYIILMPNQTDLKFRNVRPTRRRFADAALRFDGIGYHLSQTWVEYEGYPPVPKPNGYASCVGLVFLALECVRLLPDGFDKNLSPENFGGKKPIVTLWEVLNENAKKVGKTTVRLGDILLFRYSDVRESLKRPHHVGICVQESPYMFIHSASTTIGGDGRVKIEPFDPQIDPLQWQRLEEVWRVNNLRDG